MKAIFEITVNYKVNGKGKESSVEFLFEEGSTLKDVKDRFDVNFPNDLFVSAQPRFIGCVDDYGIFYKL